MIWKMSLLVTRTILGAFVNSLAANGKYPLWNFENSTLPIQMQLSKKRKVFLNFLFYFWNIDRILNILQKEKKIVITKVFPKLKTAKDVVRTLSKNPFSEDPLIVNVLKCVPNTCEILHESTFIMFFHHSEGN